MNVIVAGDFAPSDRLVNIIKERKFTEIFPPDLCKIIRAADFSFVNLESPVITGYSNPIFKCGPNLRCSSESVEAIKFAGFTGATMANNHILDYGKEGLVQTINSCKNQRLDIVGAGENIVAAGKVLYLKKGNETLAVINCCEHEFSIATETTAGANPLNPIRQFYAIQEAKQTANYVVVIVHGGHEHFQLPSTRMQETYRYFIDAGADAVVNHHQHCYSGYEIYNKKPIFYGIGNFCFDSPEEYPAKWYEGYLVKLMFEKGKIEFSLYPYEQCKKSARVTLIQDKTEFETCMRQLNNIIADSLKLKSAENAYYATGIRAIQSMYQPYGNRILNKLYRLHLLPSLVSPKKFVKILNYVSCEAHRDKQLFALKKIIDK